MNGHAAAAWAAAITGVLVGAAMVSTRVVSDDASPETLAFLRYLVGMGVLLALVWRGVRLRFAWRDAAAVAALGVLQFAVLIVLLNHALRTLPAALCALVFSTMPLLTMGLAILLRREVFSLRALAGLLLAVSGIALLLGASPSEPGVATGDSGGALAAVFGATAIGAVCSILYRPLLARYPVLPTSVVAMFAAVIFLAVLCTATAQPLVPRLGAAQWANVAFIGLSSGVGYFCWLWALRRIDASRVVAFQALGPVTAAAIELVLMRRPPSAALLIAIALVVTGLVLAMRPTRGGRAPGRTVRPTHGGRKA